MQLDPNAERMYHSRDSSPATSSKHRKNTKLKTIANPASDLYPYLDVMPSELDGYHHAMTADFWYTQNGEVLAKRELHQTHDYSFDEYPMYGDLKNPVMAPAQNAENGLYLLPLSSTIESPPKKGLFKNLKSALFAKKNSKRQKGNKQTLHLPVIDLSNEYDRPVLNREVTVNKLRSSYSMDCLNVIENTIVWRELSEAKSLTLNNKHNRLRRNSGPDILADLLKNNNGLANKNLMHRFQMQSEKAKAKQQNGVSIFAHAQRGDHSVSESQSDIFFGEEVAEPRQEDMKVHFGYAKHQNKKMVPNYYQQQLQQQPRITNKHTANYGSNIPLSKLKDSLNSSTSSTRSSLTSSAQDESRFLSLSSLTLDSAKSPNLHERQFHTLETNSPRHRHLQSQADRWEQGHTGFTRGLSESGVSIESSDSGLGSYSGSYVAKVKRTVHFNGSDEVFEYIPVNSGHRKPQRLKQGTVVARNRGRKTKIATYL